MANTLLGMGGVAAIGASAAAFASLDLRFIDPSSMAAFGALMVATGLMQHWLVRQPSPAPARAHDRDRDRDRT
ncbi:MAG: hypothetical protein Q8N23_32960 [Archangium sp.]|nr:hypothetical protein [Archangium sp.]MDP3574290.1 hypothetical protein [Archangium sp.]